MNQNTIYLLSIYGKLAPKTLEAARALHNQTAGAPANIAAAKSLGDLSHMVYVPLGQPGPEAGEFLILDLWNSMDGLNQFFADPHVQEQGGQIFSQRDPVVWEPAADFYSYHLPVPAGKNDRFVGVVRGMVRSRQEACQVHNELVAAAIKTSRSRGNISHEAYFRLSPPGSPESLEFFAVDTWMDAQGMGQQYQDPDFLSGFGRLFAAAPMASVWAQPAGSWAEW
jgi:quinol monooxygenase YgiN